MCGLCRVRRARLTRHNPHMTMTQAPVTETGSDDARAAARMAWARSVSSGSVEALHRASADAGFRSYWRGAPDGIVMDSPPRLEDVRPWRSEEHTSELQSLMRISYAVFCWKKKND